jgi:predicted ATPase/DNA-binding CsgD family transcriptional regulator
MSDASIGQADLAFPLRGACDGGPGTLPRPLTSFVGRQRELAEAGRLLESSRLLTLTGPGGSGKTRLCIELAAAVAAGYPDGVYFVPLASITDPGLVLSSIAQGIGLQDSRGRPLMEHLASHLREKKFLIVLDNFEHLLAAAPVVAELLGGARDLRIIVSSRSPLRVSGEQECPVPPLALPDLQAPVSLASIGACESVRLFAERAAAAVPGFAVGEENAASVTQIARRLDGLPLAIELAAARVRLLPPEAILPRLEQSLSLLVGGSRDLPDRQQTLRSTIAWSYDLLSAGARRLLAACSVFRGGASLEIIESVCAAAADIGMPVLDALQELVEHSLLRQVQATGAPRYAMLETIREFAAERLAEMPEAAGIRGAHAAAFLALGREARRPLTGPELLGRLDLEHDNIRAAIDWYRQEDPAAALRLAAAMSGFWSVRGHFTEGRERLRELLGVVAGENRARAGALNAAGWLAIDQGDHRDAVRRLTESIELSRRLNDSVGEGMAVLGLGRSNIACSRVSEAAAYVERAGALLSAVEDPPGVALTLLYSGLVALFTDQLEAACELFGRCAAMCRELGFQPLGARALQLLGIARLDLGDLKAARAALEEALPVAVEIGDRWAIPIGLSGFAGLAARTGRPRLALRLAGAAEACREANEFATPEPHLTDLDRWLTPSRKAVGGAAARILAQGRQMTLQEAVACALANEPEDARRPGPRRTLTNRETEVAVLAARGLTNRDIAARLCLSVRTVEVHVDHILTKLGFRTRTQLAAWAYEEGLRPEDT